MKTTKPTIKTLIGILNSFDKLKLFINKYLNKNAKDLAIYAEQYIQNLKWTTNEICEILKRLDHDIVANYVSYLKGNAPFEELITKSTMKRYAELLNSAINDIEDGEPYEPYNIKNYFSKKEIEKRNLICDLLKNLSHAKVAKRIIDLQNQGINNCFEKAILDVYKKS